MLIFAVANEKVVNNFQHCSKKLSKLRPYERQQNFLVLSLAASKLS